MFEKEAEEIANKHCHEMKNRISMALKDPILQQGFEIICKENAELKEKFTRAKEIIENIIRVTWGEGWNYSLDWKVKAEQFLNNEVEK